MPGPRRPRRPTAIDEHRALLRSVGIDVAPAASTATRNYAQEALRARPVIGRYTGPRMTRAEQERADRLAAVAAEERAQMRRRPLGEYITRSYEDLANLLGEVSGVSPIVGPFAGAERREAEAAGERTGRFDPRDVIAGELVMNIGEGGLPLVVGGLRRGASAMRTILARLPGRWAIISAEREGMTIAEKTLANRRLYERLVGLGYEPKVGALGSWGGVMENPLIVPGLGRREAAQLGREFGQPAVIHFNNQRGIMHNLEAGTEQVVTDIKAVGPEAPTDFTQTPEGDRFSLSFGTERPQTIRPPTPRPEAVAERYPVTRGQIRAAVRAPGYPMQSVPSARGHEGAMENLIEAIRRRPAPEVLSTEVGREWWSEVPMREGFAMGNRFLTREEMLEAASRLGLVSPNERAYMRGAGELHASMFDPDRIARLSGMTEEAAEGFGREVARGMGGAARPQALQTGRPWRPGVLRSSRLGRAVHDYLLQDEAARAAGQRIPEFEAAVKTLPGSRTLVSGALAGGAALGWYQRSAQALVEAFGPEAPRFAALLGALSPRQIVSNNVTSALDAWEAWKALAPDQRQNRQLVEEVLNELAHRTPQGRQMRSRLPNALRALLADDPAALALSGPKVFSFHRNLIGETQRVTLDSWMARLGNVDPGQFTSRLTGAARPDVFTKEFGVPSPLYLAYSGRVRQTADELSRLTGRRWTPAEVQETLWAWGKSLGEMAEPAATEFGAQVPLLGTREMIPLVTPSVVARQPDILGLMRTPEAQAVLGRAGANVPRASLTPPVVGLPTPENRELQRLAENLTESYRPDPRELRRGRR